MRDNTLRTLWARDEAVLNAWITIPNSWVAEVIARQGWDSVTIDVQHGLMHYDVALGMLQGISTTPAIPLVRAPWNEPGILMKLLDAGAYGVICPMINTRTEAEAFVGACRYPPLGYRSYGPLRAALYAGADYVERANDTILTFAMIETAQGVRNADDICATPGLDGIYVGPSDLSISLGGRAGASLGDGLLAESIQQVLNAAHKHGLIAGIHTGSTHDARRMIEMGFRFVSVQSDLRYLSDAAQAVLTEMKQRSTQAQAGPY